MYFTAAVKYLPENDPLRKYIIDFYSDTERLTDEFSHLFKSLNNEQIEAKIREYSDLCENKTLFVERMQKFKARQDSFARQKEWIERNPLADNEEYEAGAYRDELESQVSDAVFALRKKNYNTFQSGFSERKSRDQFMDFYNKGITIPALITEHFKDSFKFTVTEESDRTTVNIEPLKSEPVSLEEWKSVWDYFAREMPVTKNAEPTEEYTVHSEFRKNQDILRRGI